MTAKTGKKTERKTPGKKSSGGKSSAGKSAGAKPRKTRRSSSGRRKSKARKQSWRGIVMGLSMILLLCVGGYTVYSLLHAPSPSSSPVASSQKTGTDKRRGVPSKPSVPAKPATSTKPSASATGPTAPAKPGAPPVVPDQGDAISSADGTVRRALRDLQLLPYEETYGHSLEETISQVDKALLQVARRLGLPAEALREVAVVNLSRRQEAYTFRRLDVFVGEQSRAFERELGQTVGVWAENASVKRLDPGTLEIVVKGVRTHLLLLRPTKPPLSVDTGVRPGRHRLRRVDEEAKLTIVIDDLGANMGAVKKLLALDYPVTFAFWPHAAHTREGANAAHAYGREILVHLPMEPEGYPSVKPGPGVLLRNATAEQIRGLTDRALERVPYAVGLNNHMGSRFTRSREGVRVVLEVLHARGMFMLDSLTHPRSVFYGEAVSSGVPAYCRDVFLDHVVSGPEILAALRRAEATALLTGRAVAIGHPHPQTLEVLKEWEKLRNPAVRIVRLQDLPR